MELQFGNKILMVFIKSKYNFKQIAEKLGVSYSTVLSWKDGKTMPNEKQMANIKRHFKKEVAEYDKENRKTEECPECGEKHQNDDWNGWCSKNCFFGLPKS